VDKVRYRSDIPGGFRRARKNVIAVGLVLAMWGARYLGVFTQTGLTTDYVVLTCSIAGVAGLGYAIYEFFVPAIEMDDTTLTIRNPEERETVNRIPLEGIEGIQVSGGRSRNLYQVQVATVDGDRIRLGLRSKATLEAVVDSFAQLYPKTTSEP